jgi:hypothetical protein
MSRLRAALLGTGVVVIGYAVLGSFLELGGKLGGVLLFLVAVLVLHDGVWLPLVLVAGALFERFVPARHRGPIRVGLIAAAALTVAALPLALGFGRTADNPSALPLNYGRNLALVLLAVTVATGLAVARARRRNRKDSESSDDHSGR